VRPYLEKKKNHKKGLVKWLKVQALSSSPSTAKKKKKMRKALTPNFQPVTIIFNAR
jgi:hypothetical protein